MTYVLHLSLSSAILTDSSTESPVHVLMLSILAVSGLPRLRAPIIVPFALQFANWCSVQFACCERTFNIRGLRNYSLAASHIVSLIDRLQLACQCPHRCVITRSYSD